MEEGEFQITANSLQLLVLICLDTTWSLLTPEYHWVLLMSHQWPTLLFLCARANVLEQCLWIGQCPISGTRPSILLLFSFCIPSVTPDPVPLQAFSFVKWDWHRVWGAEGKREGRERGSDQECIIHSLLSDNEMFQMSECIFQISASFTVNLRTAFKL